MLQKLESGGFIEKRPDNLNKKIKKIFPTAKGNSIYPSIIKEHVYSNDVALTGFSETEKHEVFEYLYRIRTNIEKDWEYVKKGNKRDY